MPGFDPVAEGDLLQERYRVLEPLSEGAMGAVYRATDEETGEPVAIKRLLDMRQKRRFEIEARLLARLDHPRVVPVLGHFETEGGDHFLVMDLVPGPDLYDVLHDDPRGVLDLDTALGHVRQTAEALDYVHAQHVVHRDVKPSNLILSGEGIVLVDFGIARELEPGELGTEAIGTPGYMAPEVLLTGAAGPASDVYGLGATLWTLLSGRPPPMQDGDLEEVLPPRARPVCEPLCRALQFQPERRQRSARAFAEAMGHPLGAAAGAGLAVSTRAGPAANVELLEAVARTAAGVFGASATSIALTDADGSLVYQAAWGAGAHEVLRMRLPRGQGIAGAVVESGDPLAIPDCRSNDRFAGAVAEGTGYVPHTMVVAPLGPPGHPIGALSILDRRDGRDYSADDLPRAAMFAELAIAVIEAGGRAAEALDAPRLTKA